MNKHPFYWSSGFSIDGDRVTYEEQETLTFRATYGLSLPGVIFNWQITDFETGSLVKTLSGSVVSTSFTFLEGYKGLSVTLQIDFGSYRCEFKKGPRILMIKNTTVPTHTVDIASLPVSGGEHQWTANYAAGSIIHLTNTGGTIKRVQVKGNFSGTSTNPVIITHPNGTPFTLTTDSTYDDAMIFLETNKDNIWLYGKRDGSGNRMMKFVNGGIGSAHFTAGNVASHDGFRVIGCEVENAKSEGIKLKIDAASRPTLCFQDTWVTDCYVHGSGVEGFYLGSSFYLYNGSVYSHSMKRIRVFANESEGNGYDGLQVGSADEDALVAYNWCKNNALLNAASQNFGIVLNSGFKGKCHDNVIIREALQILPYSDTWVYNNLVYAPTRDNAIFIRRSDNPMLGSPSFVCFDPAARMFIFQNTLVSNQDTIYILDANDGGSGIVPVAQLVIINNTMRGPSPIETTELRYNEPVSGQTRTLDNYIALADLDLGFTNIAADDFTLNGTAGAFTAANEGIDASALVSISDLTLKNFYDLAGSRIPVRGYWIPSHLSKWTGWSEPDPTKTQMQWYQTALTSVFGDRVKIPEMYGARVRRYAAIGGSAKPRYLLSVKPIAKTGTIYGVETLDDQSFT